MKQRILALVALSLLGCGVAVSPNGDAARDVVSDAPLDGRDAGFISCQGGPCDPGMACNLNVGPHCVSLPAGCVVEPLPNCVGRECTTLAPCPECMQTLCPAGTQCARERRPDQEGNRWLGFGCIDRDL